MSIYKNLKKQIFGAALCAALLVTGSPVTSFAAAKADNIPDTFRTVGMIPAAAAGAAPAPLAEWPQGVSVTAEGACVMDADSKTILYGKNMDTAYYPASITKVMTALLVLENCDDLNEMVTFSQSAVELEEDNATIIGASAGDQLTVRDCLYSLLLKSANEVANALAEHVGAKFPELKENGMTDRDVFVSMMNRRAAELGCTNTHFNNPSGLTDDQHYTTAHDMCLILAAAIENERFVEIESHTYWTHAPIKRYPDPDDPWNTVYASHRMLRKNSYYYYPGVFAGKTGFTTTAGNTLVTACEKNGMTLVVTVLNGHMTHYEDTERLLDFGYDNFQSLSVTDYDTTYSALQEDLTVMGLPVMDAVTLAIDEDSRVTLPKDGEFSSVQSSLAFELSENDPDDAVAKIVYTYGGRPVGTAYLREKVLGLSEELGDIEEDPLFAALTQNTAPEVLADESAEGTENETISGGADASAGELSAGSGTNGTAGETASGEAPAGAGTNGAENRSAGAQASDAEASGKAPLISSDADGGLRVFGLHISPAVLNILKIAGIICGVLLLCGLWLLHQEKKEAQRRARRRQQRLKHTKDLTGSQNIKMDLMVQQRLRRKNGRGRRSR